MITKLQAILCLMPNAEVTVRGDYVEWIEPKIAPITDVEIQAEFDRLIAEEPLIKAKAQRNAAYVSEADPLFFKAQRDEGTIAEWKAKVAEIKARFPY